MTIPFLTRATADAKPPPTVRMFVSKDAAAVAVGADAIATTIARGASASALPVEIIRTGSRGMLWLEPLVEVEVDGVRYGFGPVESEVLDGLLNAGLLSANLETLLAHPASLGPVDKIDYLAR